MSQGFTKGVPIDTDSTMALNSDLVVPSQKAVRAYVAENLVSFTAADTPPVAPLPKSLWWNTNDGQLYIYYVDATSSQWVVANAYTGGNAYLPITGGTLSGNLNVPSLNGGPLAGSRNRIINGDMRNDQRNAGAAVTVNAASNTYTVDRWSSYGQAADGVFTVQRSTLAPTGFTNSLLATVTTADASLGASQLYIGARQKIEGVNVADLGWGAAGAQSVTMSFWVRSSVTGTFGGSVMNSAQNRSYPFTYTISAANTWEQKTITIPGDTSGTWLTNSGVGIDIFFALGVGSTFSGTAGSWAATSYHSATGATNLMATLSATWYITGVQLEAGSTATPFERRSFGQEMALCQRYYFKTVGGAASYPLANVGGMYSTTQARCLTHFPVKMRIPPTSIEQSGTASDYAILTGVGATNCSAVPTYNAATTDSAYTDFTIASGGTAGNYAMVRSTNSTAFLAWSAEL